MDRVVFGFSDYIFRGKQTEKLISTKFSVHLRKNALSFKKSALSFHLKVTENFEKLTDFLPKTQCEFLKITTNYTKEHNNPASGRSLRNNLKHIRY